MAKVNRAAVDTGNDWVADLGGFVAGFVLSFVLAPGGWAAIRARIRHE